MRDPSGLRIVTDELDRLRRRAARERSARLQAEQIAESAIKNLYETNTALDRRVEERTRELEEAVARLAAADAAKSTFLRGVAHEMSTPLHGIKGFLDLITDRTDDPEINALAGQASAAATRLHSALRTLVEFAAASAGDIDTTPQDTSLGTLGDAITARWQLPAARAGLLLMVGVTPQPGAAVRVDPARVEQIVDALVDNAIRFGVGQVDVELELLDGSPPCLRIAVTDEGPGPPADLDPFEPFVRGPGATDGFGVGLTLARAVVRGLGGCIDLAHSEGSTVAIAEFPVET